MLPISNNDSRKKLTLDETIRQIIGRNLKNTDSQVVRTQVVDGEAIAVIHVFGIHSTSPGSGRSSRQTPQPPALRNEPDTENTEELAIRALSGFTWSEDHTSPGARTERGQNLLHICAIGNYRNLLQFLFERGFDGRAKRQAKDDTGRTALRISEDMGREDITRRLSSDSEAVRSLPEGSDLPTECVLCIGLDLLHKPWLII